MSVTQVAVSQLALEVSVPSQLLLSDGTHCMSSASMGETTALRLSPKKENRLCGGQQSDEQASTKMTRLAEALQVGKASP